MKYIGIGALMASAIAAPSVAAEFVCQVRDIGNGFMTPVLAVQFEEGAATGLVYDAIIHLVHGEPIEVKMTDRGNGKFRFTYRLNDIPANPSPVDISYRIDLDTADNTVALRGLIPGVENSIIGKGQCEKGRLTQK